MLSTFLKACKNLVNRIKDNIKKITKPATASLTAGAVSDLLRSKQEYANYHNQERAHQGIDQRIPGRFNEQRPQTSQILKGKVVVTPHLNGLHHSYAYAH